MKKTLAALMMASFLGSSVAALACEGDKAQPQQTAHKKDKTKKDAPQSEKKDQTKS
jgi:hypothetical protein